MSVSETMLLKRFISNGDADAFAEIVEKYAPLVYGVCLRILSDKDRAADAVQDTFFQLVRNAANISGSLSSWLHRVATRKAIDIARTDSLRRQRESKYAANPENMQSRQENATWREISVYIDEELDSIDKQMREVLILRYFQGRTISEIARECDISHQTASRRIKSGVVSLRHKLKSRGILVPAAMLTAMLTENVVKAAPAFVMKELGKIALAGGNAAATATGSGILASLAVKAKIIATAAVITLLVGSAAIYYNSTQQTEAVVGQGQDTGSDIIARLKALDNTYLQQHTLTIERRQDKQFFFESDNVGFRETVTVTMDGDMTAYSISRYYDEEPSYPQNLPSHNYDMNGNFISWRDTHRQGLISPELNANRFQRVTKMITPDNQVLIDDEGAPSVEFRDVTSDDTYVLDYLAPILSTGRGYGSRLVRVKEIIEETPNDITFTAYGRFGREDALWNITVDTQNGYLVRSAQFYGEGRPPGYSFSTSGTKWYGDLCVAETATYWISEPNNVVTVKVQKYEPKADQELIADIHRTFTELSINTDVIDWRVNPNNPLMFRVEDSSYKDSFIPSLIGKALPDINDLNINLKQADMKNKSILICFWDMEQRPSRNCIQELNKKAEELKQKSIVIIAVQASKTDKNSFNDWIEEFNINIPMGSIEVYSEIIRFNWGVKSLPWLILTNTEHIVTNEGFSVVELDMMIQSD